MTHAIAQLEAIYKKSLDEMDEQELLTAIDAWHDDGNYLPIVELVDSLPDYYRSCTLLNEQAQAYVNLYHQTKDSAHLHKALDIYQEIAPLMAEDKEWHYDIGCVYFYLNDPVSAQQHLSCSQDVHDEYQLLFCINHALTKNISTLDAKQGGAGGVQYALEDFMEALQTYAPKIYDSLNPPATHEELSLFEQKLGVSLPDNFYTLYRTFNGQKFGVLFSADDSPQRFLSLEEIDMVKKQYATKLTQNYGTDWQSVRLPTAHPTIKNCLYHPLWLPIAMSEDGGEHLDEMSLFCLDLAPEGEGVSGAPIGVYFDELPKYYEVLPHEELQSWFYALADKLQKGELIYDEDARCLVSACHKDTQRAPNTHFYQEDERGTLEDYITRTFGKIADVFYEVISLDIECRIYVIAPTNDQPFYTLITGGMGAYAMNTPDLETPAHAELIIRVPNDWDLTSNKEKDYWPIRWLKNLARQPLHQDSHLASGHTLTTYTLADTDFEGLLILEVDTDDEQIACVKLSDDKTVFFYQLVPLYREELHYKLDVGLMALMKRLEEANIPYPPVVDTKRPNVCADHHPKDNTLSVFEGLFWTFDDSNYATLEEFYEAVYDHNNELDNPLIQFDPLQVLFDTSCAYVMYEAWLEFSDDLYEHEFLQNPHILTNKYDDHPQSVSIVSKICSDNPASMGALELLYKVHNSLANKDIGQRVFFEGFYQIGVINDDDEDVPVLMILLGN